MSARIWYSQLDAYDTIRRMLALLRAWTRRAPTEERLFICDFYFANPSLLHHTHMPADIRQKFRSYAIRRPEKEFLSLPSAPVLFAKMEAVQRQALQTLVGKGRVELDQFRQGRVALGKNTVTPNVVLTDQEAHVLQFIVTAFAEIGEDQPGVLRFATGLRRIGA